MDFHLLTLIVEHSRYAINISWINFKNWLKNYNIANIFCSLFQSVCVSRWYLCDNWPLGLMDDLCNLWRVTYIVIRKYCARVENIAVLGLKINFMLDKKWPKGKASLWCAAVFSLLFFIPTGNSKLSLIHHIPLECVLWVHCHVEKLLHELSRGTPDWISAVYIASEENVTQIWETIQEAFRVFVLN